MNKTVNKTVSVAGIAVLLMGAARAQSVEDGPRPSRVHELRAGVAAWQAQHGTQWFHEVDPRTGYVEMLYGGSAEAPLAPRNDAEWVFVARHFLGETGALHGLDAATLVPERPRLLPLAQVNTTDKHAVRFRQEIAGIPVENAFVNALLATDGSLLALQTTALPGVPDGPDTPALPAAAATRIAVAQFSVDTGSPPDSAATPSLAWIQVERAGVKSGLLGWQVEVRGTDAAGSPAGQRYSIDATGGEVLRQDELVHELDVKGRVVSFATPGTRPHRLNNPATVQPMRYIEVETSAGTITTDENGIFNFPGVNTPLTATVDYTGTFNLVIEVNGAPHSITKQILPNQPNTILLNPAPDEPVTAQANAYQHVGVVRDWIRSVDPADSTADFQAVSNVNIDFDCNAFYDGSSINFFTAGSGCVNSAYSTIVAHELGHWLNDLYGTFNGFDGMGEGNADVFAMYVYDTPIVGEDFTISGGDIRTGLNTRMFCDCGPGCYGQVHIDGEVWMGAAWKIRENLDQTHGNDMGDMIADSLFLGWMNAFDQQLIEAIIEEQWLLLDDDDGDLTNGTPNFADIDAGFLAQGFPGFTPTFVEIENVTELTITPDEIGPYAVQADLSPTANPPIAAATLMYRVDAGPWNSVAMANVGGSTWEAGIPGQVAPAEVEYFVEAEDASANVDTFPEDAPAQVLGFPVGSLTTFLGFEFEAMDDEGWVSGDPADTATTGLWVRDDPLGTGVQPEDDHTSTGTTCWFTGQGTDGGGLGEEDVDGGRTTLISPVFDATGNVNPKISYWRWYSNSFGAAPNADIFEVDLSNDGGATWVNAETVGPAGCESNGDWFFHQFAIADILPPTATMQLRFVAADENAGSLVEAAVDDVLGTDLVGSDGLGTRYCPAVSNSTGQSGHMVVTGSATVADDDLTLTATSLPRESNVGYFLMGNQMSNFTPPGADGPLCVTPVLRFLPPPENTTELNGGFSRAIGTSGPVSGNITAGSTWNFQAWHRDRRAGVSRSNLTDAVSVVFL